MRVEVQDPDEAARAQEAAEQAVSAAQAEEQQDDIEIDADVIDESEEEASDEVDEDAVAAAVDEVFSIADIEAARKDAQVANERYLRLEAEWDNFRKRTARERTEERERAAENLVEKLLPVVDDMERAIDHAASTNPEGEFSQFVEGVKAVYAKLAAVLEKTGAQVIDPAGMPFDMNEHQAVGRIEDPEAFDETVRDVYQKGYRMGKRIIRPAMVTITTGGPKRPADADDQGSAE